MQTTTRNKVLIVSFMIALSCLSGCDFINRYIESGSPDKRTGVFSKGQELYNSKSSFNKITAVKKYFAKDESQRSQGYIIKALEDKDTQVRLAAIETIATKMGPESLYYLVRKLSDSDKNNVKKTEEIITNFGVDGREEFLKLLNERNFILKRNTIHAIGLAHDDYFIDILGRIAIDETDYRYRKEAVLALAKFDSVSAYYYIESRLKDRIPKVKEAALNSMNTDGTKKTVLLIEPLLTDKAERVRISAIQALIRNGHPSGIIAINKFLNENELNSRLITEIGKAFEALGTEKTAEYFKDILEDDRKELQLSILKATIKRKEEPWAQEVLRYATEHPENDLKNMALFSLKESRATENIETIIAALDDFDWEVRESAVRALSQAPDAYRYEDVFKKMLNDDNHRVRVATVRTLSYINRRWAWELLLKIINESEEDDLILAAMPALTRYKPNQQTIEALGNQLKSENITIVTSASVTLLRTNKNAALNYYIEAIDNPNPEAQLIIIKAIDHIGNKEAIMPLRKLLNSKNKKVKDQALLTIKKLTLKK